METRSLLAIQGPMSVSLSSLCSGDLPLPLVSCSEMTEAFKCKASNTGGRGRGHLAPFNLMVHHSQSKTEEDPIAED
jgi:hypothetical protein